MYAYIENKSKRNHDGIKREKESALTSDQN